MSQPITSLVPLKSFDGSNKWYKSNTYITFDCQSAGLNKIFYKWDGSASWKQFNFSSATETLTIQSDGSETSANLFFSPAILDGMIIYKNAVPLIYGTDYTVDLASSKITFITSIASGNVITAKYNYTLDKTESFSAIGGEVYYQLQHSHIISGSIVVFQNNVSITATYDYNLGIVYFPAQLTVNDKIEISYTYVALANSLPVTETVISSAVGGPKTTQLSCFPIISNSENVVLNAVPQNRPTNYSINYSTGLITFIDELKTNDSVDASYVASTTETIIAEASQNTCYTKHSNIIDYSVSVNAITLKKLAEYTLSSSTITLSSEAFPTGLTAGDEITATYSFQQVLEPTVVSAAASQTSFYLFYTNIQHGSVRIMLNEKTLKENTDYTLNYSTGHVVLTVGMTAGDQISSDYIATVNGEIVINPASGGEVVLTLQHDNPIEPVLTLNTSTVLKSVPEYTLDTNTGEIVFAAPLLLNDVIAINYDFSITETIVNSASGELEFFLAHSIVENVILKKNAVVISTSDYLIDYISGHVTLSSPLHAADVITAQYSYYTSQINELVSNKAFTTHVDLLGPNLVSVLKNGNSIHYTYDFSTGKITFSDEILTTDTVTTTYLYAPTVSHNDIFFGPGSIYILTAAPRYAVTVLKNGITTLTEYTDFEVNYDSGRLRLLSPLSLGETLQVSYYSGGNLCIPATGIHPIEYYAVDINNVKEDTNSDEFYLDPIAPVTHADVPIGRQTVATTINFYASDSISGVAETYYTTDGIVPTQHSSTGVLVLDKTGDYLIQYFSVDYAGNVENVKSATVEIVVDSVGPSVHIQESFPINGSNGYYTTAPQITIVASDELNLDKVWYKLVSQSNITTAKYTSLASITTLDLSSAFNINIELDQSGQTYQIDLRGFDTTATTIQEIIDNINNATRTVYNIADEDSLKDGTFTITTLHQNVVSVSKIHNVTTNEYYVYLSHTYDTITFTGIKAPLASDILAVSYEYQSQNIAFQTASDATPGTGYITLLSPTAGTGSSTSEVKFLQPSSSDATGIVFGLGTAYPYAFTESNIYIQYTTPFTLPSNGRFILQAYAQDLNNNKGDIVERTYQIDSTHSVSTYNVIGGTVGNNGYYISNPTIQFSATDNLSGVNQIFYKWDALPYQEYRDTRPIDDSTVIPSEGTHVLDYYSTDRASNTEPVNSRIFKLDTVVPTTVDDTVNSTIDIVHIAISKTGPLSTLNISNNIMLFTGPEPAGPFNLNNFTMQDITDAINSYSLLGYSATLVADPSYIVQAEAQPATSLFDANNLSISPTNTLIYAGISVKLTASDVTSGIENTYYSFTSDGSIPAVPITTGLSTTTSEQVVVRVAGTWLFNTSAVGGETLAKLKYQPIYSLILHKNPGNSLLVEGVDFTLDHYTGKITLAVPLTLGQSLLATYVHGTILNFTNDGIYRVRYHSKDNAGNIESDKFSQPITIVRNLPTITYTPSVAVQSSGWFITNPNITIQASAVSATIISMYYRWDSDPFVLVANPYVTTIPSDGIHTLYAYAIDSLYRVSEIKAIVFQKDEVKPVSTDNSINIIVGEVVIASATGFETSAYTHHPYIISGTLVVKKNTVPLVLGVDYTVNYTTGELLFSVGVIAHFDQITADYECYITTNSTFNLIINVSDAVSGPYRTYYEIGTVLSPPSTPTVLSSYLSGATVTIPLVTTNDWIVKYRSQDIAGNLENTEQTQIIRVDRLMPNTTLLKSPILPNGNNSFYKTGVILSFNVNAFSVGVKATYYRLTSTSAWTKYTAPFTIPDGIYSMQYYSVDLAGNTEVINIASIKQDTASPVTTDSIPNTFVSSSEIILDVVDITSGQYKTYYKVLTSGSLPVNLKTVVGISVANVINASSITLPNAFLQTATEVIYVNSIPLTSGIDYTINYDYGIVTFLSVVTGIITADYEYFVDFDGNNVGSTFHVTAEGNYIIKYFSVDNAGNYETVKTAVNLLKIDLAPPIVDNVYPTGLVITNTTEVFGFRVRDAGINQSGIDPFSVRVFVDGIEYSLLKDSQYFIMKAVGTSYNDIINQTSVAASEVLEASALGGELNFQLAHLAVCYKTQKVYKNGILLEETLDYSFNNSLGKLSLVMPLQVNDSLQIAYRYLTVFNLEYEVAIANTSDVIVNIPVGSLSYIMNGIAASVYIVDGIPLVDGVDYSIVGSTIMFTVPTTAAVLTYKQPVGPLSTIPNFDVINTIVIDPNDVSGNVLAPIIYSFTPVDNEPPIITGLNPIPNAKDVSIYTNVMFDIIDESGVDIKTVNVNVNGIDYRLKTNATIEFQYLGTGAIATLTIANKYFITRINGQIDVSFSFLDAKYSTIQQVVAHLNSLPTYSAILLDSKYSQESSQTLVGVRNADIIVPIVLNSQPINDTSFIYKEKTNGFLVTITPVSSFENRQTVSVGIDAVDNNGNIMPTVSYSFMTQLGASDSISNRLQLMNERDLFIDDINNNLGSNYNKTTVATEIHSLQMPYANELAKFKLSLFTALNDYYFALVENRLLWQNFGSLVDFLPSTSVSLDTYRRYLLSIVQGYHAGSLKSSIQNAIALFTDGNIYVRERYLNSSDISEQFVFDVLVEISNNSSILSLLDLLNTDLYNVIRKIKPAHTFFLLGFLFRETLGIGAGCNSVPLTDIHGNVMYDYYGARSQYDGNSYRIFKNGIELIEIRDFTINTSTGKIVLTVSLVAGDIITGDLKVEHDVDEIITGVLGSNICHCSSFPIVPLSYKIYRNQILISERVDYSIELSTGVVTLADVIGYNDVIEIKYSWFEQKIDEHIYTGIGGEYIIYSDNPLVSIQFEKRVKTTSTALCDRSFIKIDSTIPYIDFYLNGKPKLFTLNQSDLNDVAQMVDTHWIVEDEYHAKIMYSETIPVSMIVDSVSIFMEIKLQETYIEPVEGLHFIIEFLENNNSFWLIDPLHPNTVSNLSDSRLNKEQVLWKKFGPSDQLRTLQLT